MSESPVAVRVQRDMRERLLRYLEAPGVTPEIVARHAGVSLAELEMQVSGEGPVSREVFQAGKFCASSPVFAARQIKAPGGILPANAPEGKRRPPRRRSGR